MALPRSIPAAPPRVATIQADRLSAADLDLGRYLTTCRRLTLEEIRRFAPADRSHTGGLYDLVLDSAHRPAVALRPALCIAAALALGGHLDGVLPSAVALELLHQGLLVRDELRGGAHIVVNESALHRLYDASTAAYVSDGMLALALAPLEHNARTLGPQPALDILAVFARMAREGAEGQMLQLQWNRPRSAELRERDYLRLVYKQVAWYSFISPVVIGSIAGGADPPLRARLGRFALLLGMAFQLHDDACRLTLDAPAPESLAHAHRLAEIHAQRARRLLDPLVTNLPGSVHKRFLSRLVDYVSRRPGV